MKFAIAVVTTLVVSMSILTEPVQAGGKKESKSRAKRNKRSKKTLNIKLTNAMERQILSPLFYMTHKCGYKLWTIGEPSSPALEVLAEDGNPTPLVDMYEHEPFVCQAGRTDAPTMPGKTTVLSLEEDDYKYCDCITTASMLISTNDAFAGLLDMPLDELVTSSHPTFSFAFDAGTEANTELCVDIPGPPCDAMSGNVNGNDDQEEYVHINRGISGIYDIPNRYDWRAAVLFANGYYSEY